MTNEHSYPCWVDTDQPDVDAARHFYAGLFGWFFSDAIPADAPGTATVDPGIRDRQGAISAPPGFEDAIGWLIPLDEGRDDWHVTFTVADRDDSVAVAEKLGATVISSEDTEWTKSARIATRREPN